MSQVDEVWIVGFENGTKWFAVAKHSDGVMEPHGLFAVDSACHVASHLGVLEKEFTLMLDGGDVKHYKREVVKV